MREKKERERDTQQDRLTDRQTENFKDVINIILLVFHLPIIFLSGGDENCLSYSTTPD